MLHRAFHAVLLAGQAARSLELLVASDLNKKDVQEKIRQTTFNPKK